MVSVIACDDGRVTKLGGGYTVVACLLWSMKPIDVEVHLVKIDGLEASATIAYSIQVLLLRNRVRVDALLLDSLTIAGFNVVSPATVKKLTGVPVIVAYKYKPSSRRLEEALRKHFKDWDLRLSILKIVDEAIEVNTRKGPLYVVTWGLDIDKAKDTIEETQIYARTPEPLRIADMIASEATLVIGQ